MTDEQFEEAFGPEYRQTLQEARDFLAHPDRLRADIAHQQENVNSDCLRAPRADPFSYRETLYRGFSRFPERLRNFIIATKHPKKAPLSFKPTIMDVEPNSRCNFRCIMCQVSSWKGGKRADDMTFSAFRDFVDGQEGIVELKLHGMGEPLLHRDYIDMVGYLSERNIWVRTNINGSLLHLDENFRRLIDAGIGEVQCSFDGATPEVYEGIRRNASFEQVVRNFTFLNEYANAQSRPYTRMWVVVQERNRHQMSELVECAVRMGFRRLTFSLSLNDWGQEVWKETNKRLEARGGLSREEEQRLADLAREEGIEITLWKQAAKYSARSPETLCPWPFTRPYVSSDLRLVPCCMIANPQIQDLGDARAFENHWNGDSYQSFRRAHLEGNIPLPCKSCYEDRP